MSSSYQAIQKRLQSYKQDYLELLGMKVEEPTLDYLTRMMQEHLHRIPFDGSDLTLNHPEKIILKNKEILAGFLKGKGGVCYQMNGAFCKLLQKLGFQALLATVTMHRFGEEYFPYAKNHHDVHCCILVTLANQEYLVDLVWGNAFRTPLAVGNTVMNPAGTRKLERSGEQGYQLSAMINDEWQLEYEFSKTPQKTKSFSGDVRFICSTEHHLSRRLLLMRPQPDFKFNFVIGEKNGLLSYIKTAPDQESKKEEIHSETRARQIFAKFHVDPSVIPEILNNFKLK